MRGEQRMSAVDLRSDLVDRTHIRSDLDGVGGAQGHQVCTVEWFAHAEIVHNGASRSRQGLEISIDEFRQ